MDLSRDLQNFYLSAAQGISNWESIFSALIPNANFYFSVAVHGATVLSTIVVLWKEIADLFKGFFKFRFNDETKYVIKILISMIPVGIAGFF